MTSQALFEPFSYKSLVLKNRFVMSPMTRNFSPGGVPDAAVAAYYRRRAEAQVGLIISEGSGIDRPAALTSGPAIPRLHGDDALQGWSGVIKAVHEAGGRMAPQLWHCGGTGSAIPNWSLDVPPESPSGLYGPDSPMGIAMSEEDIADTIAAFARAAAMVQKLGFDAAEIHAAHGYLIDQFLWHGTNVRTDDWGGKTLRERARFAVELVKAIRAAVGPDFPILLRLSQWKQQDYAARLADTPPLLESLVVPLAEAGVDIFHCSQRRYWEPEFEDSDLNLAGWVKKLTGQPTITVGSVGLSNVFLGDGAATESQPMPLDDVIRRLERGDFDLVAVGRALLQDPNWVTKIFHEQYADIEPFTYAAAQRLY